VQITPLVLEDQGIDLILGMNWLNQYQVMMDLSTRSLRLNTLDRQLIEVELPLQLNIGWGSE
jgi:hypothetical protein